MHRITGKQILQQLKADLIGKDSYRGVTLTYSWLANQLGHFTLGFVPTFLLFLYLERRTDIEHPIFLAPIIVSAFWLLFEVYNVLGPLLLKRKSASKHMYAPSKKYIFPPSWANLAFDTVTDLCFFWLGSCAVTLAIDFRWPIFIITVGLLLVLAYPSYYWYVTKLYQQSANFPVQLRLSQFETDMNDADKEKIYRFRDSKGKRHHLFVFGSKQRGTTKLAVGLATEKAIKHQTCMYTTVMKLFSMFSEPDDLILREDQTQLWTWRKSQILVIDDINPGSPISDLIVPETFITMLDVLPDHNRDAICNKSIIWVMGKQKPSFDGWESMLKKLGICKENIFAVDLA